MFAYTKQIWHQNVNHQPSLWRGLGREQSGRYFFLAKARLSSKEAGIPSYTVVGFHEKMQ